MPTNWKPLPESLDPAARRLAEELRLRKDAAGMTLAELGARTHYSRASWERWLNGKRLISRAALRSMIQAFGIVGIEDDRLSSLLDQAEAEAQTEPETNTTPASQPSDFAHRDVQLPAPTPPRPAAYLATAFLPAVSPQTARTAHSPYAPFSPHTPPHATVPITIPTTPHRVIRHQLPADTPSFIGRQPEVEALLALADRAARREEPSTAVISAIDGMAGIGKSALAVRVAHRVRHHFPDGQLFLDLRGNDSCEPLTAAQALDRLLRSLAVPAELIPADLAERAALYRHRLAGSRTLLVLDDAVSTAQIRPLLPGEPGCLVLITSRRHLAGLDDATWITLDTLSGAESVELFHRVAGPGRVPAGHPAVPELTALCGHLPLAIRILAARLRMRRALSVETLLTELRGQPNTVSGLRDEDRSVAAVLEPSYAALSGAEQSMLRRLAPSCAGDVDVLAAANLAGVDPAAAENLLESLLDHNMLLQRTPGRYLVHDLVRAYVRALPPTEPAPRPESRESALAQLRAEHENFLSALTNADEHGDHLAELHRVLEAVNQFAEALAKYHETQQGESDS